jgi:hypothetical protein
VPPGLAPMAAATHSGMLPYFPDKPLVDRASSGAVAACVAEEISRADGGPQWLPARV